MIDTDEIEYRIHRFLENPFGRQRFAIRKWWRWTVLGYRPTIVVKRPAARSPLAGVRIYRKTADDGSISYFSEGYTETGGPIPLDGKEFTPTWQGRLRQRFGGK